MKYNDGRSRRKKDVPPRECIICKKIIPRNTTSGSTRINIAQYQKTRFCSRACRAKWQSANLRGKNNYNWKNGNIKTKCVDCGKIIVRKYNKKEQRCRPCSSLFYRGVNSWAWQGGKTLISKLDRIRREAKHWRIGVFERDDYICQLCGYSKGHILNAHHIKPWAKYPELRFDLDNGITLCRDCHIKIHKKNK
jgi:5-methylcytosine-specific restriction endonuclease McrA